MKESELRWDEAERMSEAEESGIERGSDDWERYLAMYRGTLRWAWIGAGESFEGLLRLILEPLRRGLYRAMRYELPRFGDDA